MTRIKTSLRLLRWEMALTKTMASMSVLVPFFNSIGMDQEKIGLSQALFTVVLLVLNVPMGWLADRFSHKFSNVIGDTITTSGLVYYAFAQGFFDVLAAEVILGIGLAVSHGADGALLRSYSHALGKGEAGYQKVYASTYSWSQIAQMIALLVGGFVGSFEPRYALALAAVPFAVGAVLSLFLKDTGERLVSTHRNPLKDMVTLTTTSVGRNPRLRWLIIAFAVGREITHPMIWVLTPLLLLAGVPLQIVAVGWVLNSLMVVLGARMAGWWALRLNEWQRFAFPMFAVLGALAIMSIHFSLGTIWLYAVMGLAQGWIGTVVLPMIQQHTASDRQATVISIAGSASQLLYIPLVWVINAVGVVDIRLTMVATIVIFAPMVMVTAWKLATVKDA